MTTNLLVAIKNIAANPVTDLKKYYNRPNKRANSKDETLENYIKDVFGGTMNVANENERDEIFSSQFSYFGNQNNPPDMMIQGGDAIKIKNMQNRDSGIAIYTAYPEDLLYADHPAVSSYCRDAEVWTQKDLLYVVLLASSETLKSLWFVYGDCYFASRDFYQKALTITDPLQRTKFDFLNENSLPFIRSTALSPEYLIDKSVGANTGFLNALMTKKKYESFPIADRNALEALKDSGLVMHDCSIRSPNDPSLLLDAKFISYQYLQ